MNLHELVLKNRSVRRFHEHRPVSMETLRELVELARLAPSAANRQPLKYVLACTPERNARIFPHLLWAAYLPEWGGPGKGERPAAYIVILLDKDITAAAGCDHGIVAQTMLLGAVEKGLAGCMVGSIRRAALLAALALPERYEVLLVLALGFPAENVKIEPPPRNGDIRYWRDESGAHHVPKRALEEIILPLHP